MLFKTRLILPKVLTKLYQSKAGVWFPEYDFFMEKHQNILARLGTPRGIILIPGSNIVTSAGDVYYAQKACGESPTNTFGTHVMATAGTPGKAATYATFTPIAASIKASTATYPKTNDGDTDNTGAGTSIVTWLATYAKADFNNTAITHGLITKAAPSGTDPLLTGYAFAATFSKTVDDTLKVFANHTLLGV